ncbi:MAG: barstar family protein [Xanthomonadales bacterium]|nr:barstar family protein [Xanthomonadales bacterium]
MSRRESVAVDLTPIQSKQALHAALKDALDFPDWYGMNWDAFWDAITGVVDMPKRLKLSGWPGFQARLPREAHQLKSALDEMSEKYPKSAAMVIYE